VKIAAKIVAAVGALILAATGVRAASILTSVHNLSVTGPGTIKSDSRTNLCSFCHITHHATGATPLWNHALSSVTNYTLYTSGTLKAVVGQPDGSSRLCLSCHDGTVALGMLNSSATPIVMNGGVVNLTGTNNLGTDLSTTHPISFKYNAGLRALDPNLVDPVTLTGVVKVDKNGEMQCTSCHDPHNNQFGKFLVKDNTSSALCLTCHTVPGWLGSGHGLSARIETPPVRQALAVRDGAPLAAVAHSSKPVTVAAEGCNNCHSTHFAGGRQRLLKFSRPEDNCVSCHKPQGVGADVATEFAKVSAHPITLNSASHSPDEKLVNPDRRHVTCSDCHNPHAAVASKAPPAGVSAKKLAGGLVNVAGVSAGGVPVKSISQEAELCFRCHADSLGRGPARIDRQTPQTNMRLAFNALNLSFHPVERPGKAVRSPSLIAPWTTTSVMNCTDCHNSDQSPAAGGKGANGPHGSSFIPLLERELALTDYGQESPAAYALCYKCHSRDSILADQSFRASAKNGSQRGHRFHVADQRTACTTCHDSHGAANAKSLVNFNVRYVSPASNGRLTFTSGRFGPDSGTCTLKCHGFDHLDAPFGAGAALASQSSLGPRTR
jgi:predicted CXXCH cytochrome family protein